MLLVQYSRMLRGIIERRAKENMDDVNEKIVTAAQNIGILKRLPNEQSDDEGHSQITFYHYERNFRHFLSSDIIRNVLPSVYTTFPPGEKNLRIIDYLMELAMCLISFYI